MRECNNSKIHISSNFILSKSLIIMLDTLFLVPSLRCNTSQHFATLHHTTLHYTLIWLNPFTFAMVLFPLPSLNQTQYGYHIPKLISQNNEPLHCPKEPLTISLHFSFLFFSFFSFLFFFFLSYQPFTSLYFAIHLYNSLPFTSLPFTFTFYCLHFPHCFTLS